MPCLRKQHTIATPATVDGYGYWHGEDVRVEFRPAEANSGIVFIRHDIDPKVRIPATIESRVETPRRTTLTHQGVRVEMVEHVMAALAGLEIHNCEVWVNRPELPGCDGSALPFVEALDRAGIVELDAARKQLVVCETTRLGNDESWIEVNPTPQTGLTIKYRLDYGHVSEIGRQTIQLNLSPNNFRHQLAASRTFMLKEEADWLLERGLGTRVTTNDLLVFGPTGPIDNQLRFPDECVRHKALDLIGDLALAGGDLVGSVFAHRSGHRLNAELVRVLLNESKLLEDRKRSA